MRSPEQVQRSGGAKKRTSLRTRVAVAAALVAALVGLVAAGVAALLVDELAVRAQDRRLTDAALLMQRELDSEGGDARRHVDDEAIEIAPVGLRMALFEHGTPVAGDRDLARAASIASAGCTTRSGATDRWRTCAIGEPARRIVVSTRIEGDSNRRGVLVLSVGAAALLASIVAALTSRALAGWALSPLTALGARLEKISDATRAEADLGQPSTTAEVEALRETIAGLLGRLGEAMDRSRTFAASAAHELRTPLATMTAELDLALEVDPQQAPLVRLRRTVGRLSVLVEHLLMSATGTSDALLTEAVALEDVVRDVVAARSEDERARLVPSFDASGTVRGDEALLRIVVDNLVDNALKFSPCGEILVVVAEDAGKVHLTVRDEGPGVDAEEVDTVLLPFVRGTASKSSPAGGHGLGLSTVAHAVRLHRGELRFVHRAKGETGAEVRVTLPAWTPVTPSEAR